MKFLDRVDKIITLDLLITPKKRMNMRTKNCYLLVVFFSIIIMSCGANIKSKKKNVFAKDNLCAWCLVPYDSLNRNPEQRAQMMKDLGITRFA